MDLSAFKREVVEYYARMSSDPAWKGQAWHAINELAKNYPTQCADLPQMLVVEMNKRKETK